MKLEWNFINDLRRPALCSVGFLLPETKVFYVCNSCVDQIQTVKLV